MRKSNFKRRIRLVSYVTGIFDIIEIRDLYKFKSDDKSLQTKNDRQHIV
jgi:hypothetical protein